MQTYAIPVEYFVDICLRLPLTVKTASTRVHTLLETAPSVFDDAAQRTLSKYGLVQQETHRVLDAMAESDSPTTPDEGHSRSAGTVADFSLGLLEIDRLLNPEFDFVEVIDEFLASCKEILDVDRACLYVVDRANDSVKFFGLPIMARQNSNAALQAMAALSVGEGVDFSLSGVIEHVVNHAALLNVANFTGSEFYDPSVEKRTCYGRRIKQILLTPVFDAIGHVIAVLQFTNTKSRDAFSAHDVSVACAIANRAALIKRIIPDDDAEVVPVHLVNVNDCLSFRLDHLITAKTNRHLRGTVQLYVGSQPIGPAVSTATAASYPVAGNLHRCDFKQDVAIRSLALSHLPQTTKIIFSFESSNHHPIVWCGVYLFDYMRKLRQGVAQITMWDGAVPNEIPSLLEGLYSPDGIAQESYGGRNDVETVPPCLYSSGSVLMLDFPERATAVVHKIPNTVKYYRTMGVHTTGASNPLPAGFAPTPVPLQPGTSPTEWYARQMTTSELSIYQALNNIVDVIAPSDIDAETSRLVWRMRNALCVECPWALLWFLLCCDWTQKSKVEEAHRLLYCWGSVTPLMAMPLLDGRLRDPKVRCFAVNLLDQLSESEFQDCLYQLVHYLRFETYVDSALARLLLRRALHEPDTTGKQLVWYLYSQFAMSPVACVNHQRLLKTYLRSLPDQSRAHQGHGLYAMHRIDSIYNGLVASNLLVSKSAHMSVAAEAEQTVNLLLGELNQNPWPSEFLVPTPLHSNYTDGVIHCKKLQNIPHSIVFTLKHPEPQPPTRVLYSQAVGVKAEVVYQQLMRTLHLIWQQEGIHTNSLSYDALAIGGSKAVAQDVVSNGKPLIALLAHSSHSESFFSGTSSPPGSPNSYSAKTASLRSVPDNLLLKFFAQQVVAPRASATDSTHNMQSSAAVWDTVNEGLAARNNFIKSLAGNSYALILILQILCVNAPSIYF